MELLPRFTIDMIGETRSLKQVLADNDKELTKRIVTGVLLAIDNDLDYIEIAEILVPGQCIIIECSRPKYVLTLLTNLNTLIEYEEYELCAEIKKYLNSLQKNLGESKY